MSTKIKTEKQVLSKNSKLNIIILPAVLVVLILLTFYQTTGHEFVWDDDIHIIDNSYDQIDPDVSLLKYWKSDDKLLYAPVTYSTWGLIKKLSHFDPLHPDPLNFHLLNIIIHILNSIFIFLILKKIFSHALFSFLGSLVFALHPLQVEAVAWATGSRILLAGFFSFLSILFYLHYRKNSARKNIFYILSILSFFLALMSKPSSIIAPIFIALIDLISLKNKIKKIYLSLIPFFFLMFFYVIFLLNSGKPVLNEIKPIWARFFIFFDSICFYLYKIIYPLKLSSFYGRTPTKVMQTPWLYLSWIIPLGLFYLTWKYRTNKPKLLLAYLILIFGILPVSGFIPFEAQNWNTVADRYMYLSMFGISILICFLFQLPKKLLLKVGLVLIIAFWIVRSAFYQVPFWQNNRILWSKTIDMFPNEYIPYNRRASLNYKEGKFQQAIRDYSQALEINPGHFKSYYGRALAYQKQTKTDLAIQDYTVVIDNAPSDSTAIYNRAMLYLQKEEYDKAISDLNRLLMLNKKDIMALYNRAAILFYLGHYQKAYDDLTAVKNLGGKIDPAFWEDLIEALNNMEKSQ